MKKIFVLLSIVALFAMSSAAQAGVERVDGSWSVLGTHPISFTCGGGEYNHTMVVDEEDLVTGDFSGTGSYDPNSAYTWDVVGNTSGDDITFTLVYTGANAGYTINGEGIINSDGSIEGEVDNNCQTFSMDSDTATKESADNHGQYVKSQCDKKAAAQSRIGMPVKSKGHTK